MVEELAENEVELATAASDADENDGFWAEYLERNWAPKAKV